MKEIITQKMEIGDRLDITFLDWQDGKARERIIAKFIGHGE